MSSAVKHYEFIVIGGGSGGVGSARRASQYGAKTLLIEGKKLGGTCVNVGCIPKKLMWYASNLAKSITDAHDYKLFENLPLNKENLTFNWREFVDKRDSYLRVLNGIYEENLKKFGVDIDFGWATFDKQGHVEVSKHDGTKNIYSGDHILIATGGKPIIPNQIPGYEFGIDSDGFFSLKTQPKKTVVVGAGYIGIELAGVLNGLGTEAHLVIRGKTVLRKFDILIQETITDHYVATGINVHKEAKVQKVEKRTDGKLNVTLTTSETIEGADCIIWTIGRKSYLDFGLENIGVKLNDKGQILTDEYQNTSVPNVYSLGDVSGRIELTPVAIAAGRKLSNRLFGPEKFAKDKLDYTNIPSVVFSHPEVGTIGLSEAKAIEQFGQENLKIYNTSFSALYYSMLQEKTPTKYKLICAGPTEKVVGLHIVGDCSSEIMQGFGVAIKMGAVKADFDNCVAIHPTSAEELVTLK
ncbi:hypothetical protein Kpol_1048p46 [Vanderwaltozyma polyspora DSM 70294]|uniref:Glutathione reductase n=1 Tax=Vanderwaltozyma polyspora (strain ATCC 22028 / DSM 70294 / BCRC 21397 / CBS 2163 / NBRC 10782 / NRRL Y-8283 / UCD 57-17) TaxID=436907 RepID=A7TGK8_VANPO|nr:uncharacterized protein Kpol_1048p46 [Vanderwaltozyma polyspora DSM 70294]EDO18615.1 hypothetical protein Kpol_1048p46 [Vanderwaltozyma polyspora DSM 70294]